MPQSLVLNLTTQSTIPREQLQGYALQQLFFDLVEAVDPELGHVLRRDKHNRSYSLSALQLDASGRRSRASQEVPAQSYLQSNVRLFIPRTQAHASQLQYTHRQAIAADSPCWWRISFLDDDLFDHLIFLWNQLRDEAFPLGAGSITIKSITADLPGIDWASSCSYRDIYEQAATYERDIHLQFVTPTAFNAEGHTTPLPTADAVFQPLRRRWNQYSGLAFAPSLISNIVPTHFNIQTETTQNARRSSPESIVGCTGQISFRIAGDDDPLIIKRINTLADFTRYCAIGCNTCLGMGTLRRLNRPTMIVEQSS